MRVTNAVVFNTARLNIQRQQTRLLQAQEEAATGKRVRRPSDDVPDARRILSARDTLAALGQFKRNRSTLDTLLKATDTSLQDVNNLLVRAKELAVQGANDTLTRADREFIAQEVAQLLEQAVQTGNTNVAGRHIFAGRQTSQPPFSAVRLAESTVSGLTASGTLPTLGAGDLTINGITIRVPLASDDALSTSDNAASALALATVINEATTTGVRAQASTTLSLTATAFGNLSAGEFAINGVDVTGAITDTASLAAAVNAANIPGVHAAIGGANTLTLTAADGRSLQLQTPGGVSGLNFSEFDLSGGALDQTTTGTVRLFADTAFTIAGTNPAQVGLNAGEVTQIVSGSFAGDNGVVDLALSAGQSLTANTIGSDFLVADLRPSINANTPLSSLRQGQGIQAGSITVTDRAGGTATINLSAATTVGDVLSAISGAAGINVTATVNTAGTGIAITDDNLVPTQNLEVDSSATASDLGIVANRPGDIVGTPLKPRLLPSTQLAQLYEGKGVKLGTLHIANGTTEVDVDLSTAQTIEDVIDTIQGAGANVTARLNVTGTALEVRSNDPATVAVVTEVNNGTTAAALGIQGPSNTLNNLGLLQEALRKNDQSAIDRLLSHIDAGTDRVAALRANVGARLNRVELVEQSQGELEIAVTSLLSDAEDADVFEAFSRLANLETALQATLAATARAVQPTLLDFLR